MFSRRAQRRSSHPSRPRRFFSLSLEMLEARVAPAVFSVSSAISPAASLDSADRNGDVQSVASLAAAIDLASSNSDASNTINLAPGIYATAEQVIRASLEKKSLTIVGQGEGAILRSDGTGRVLEIDANVELRNITIEGGNVQAQPGTNSLLVGGGGLLIVSGDVTLRDTVIQGNVVRGRNGYDGAAGGSGQPGENGGRGDNAYGGGLYVESGSLTLINSTITNNRVIGGDGGRGGDGGDGEDGAPGFPGAPGENGENGGNGGNGGWGGDAFGGGIYVVSSVGHVAIRNSFIEENTAQSGSGGLGGIGGNAGRGGDGNGEAGGNGGVGGTGGGGGYAGYGHGGGIYVSAGSRTPFESVTIRGNSVLGGEGGQGGAGGAGNGGGVGAGPEHPDGQGGGGGSGGWGAGGGRAMGGGMYAGSAVDYDFNIFSLAVDSNSVLGGNGGAPGIVGIPGPGASGPGGSHGGDGGDAVGGGIFFINGQVAVVDPILTANIAMGGDGSDGASGGNGSGWASGGQGGYGGSGGRALGGGVFAGAMVDFYRGSISGSRAIGGDGGMGAIGGGSCDGSGGKGGDGGLAAGGAVYVPPDASFSFFYGAVSRNLAVGGDAGNAASAGGLGGSGGAGGSGGDAWGGGVSNADRNQGGTGNGNGFLNLVNTMVDSNHAQGGRGGDGRNGAVGRAGRSGRSVSSGNGEPGLDGSPGGSGGGGGNGGNALGGGVYSSGGTVLSGATMGENTALGGNGGWAGDGANGGSGGDGGDSGDAQGDRGGHGGQGGRGGDGGNGGNGGDAKGGGVYVRPGSSVSTFMTDVIGTGICQAGTGRSAGEPGRGGAPGAGGNPDGHDGASGADGWSGPDGADGATGGHGSDGDTGAPVPDATRLIVSPVQSTVFGGIELQYPLFVAGADDRGLVAGNLGAPMTMEMALNPGDAALEGEVTANPFNGVAAFEHLSLEKHRNDSNGAYNLRAQILGESLVTGQSNDFYLAGYTPQQIRAAYGLDDLPPDANGDPLIGLGQTIAIVIPGHHPTIAQDLAAFDLQYGLDAPPSFQLVGQDNSGSFPPYTTAEWDYEAALDVEWAHAIAPGANLVLVETNSSLPSDLYAGVSKAASLPGVSVVSMSWAHPEYSDERSHDQYFTTPAGHQGVTFVAASGDDGYPGGYPAYSPNVVAVGGTALVLNWDNSYQYEWGWSGSGGGISLHEPRPAYQDGVQRNPNRTIPDVGFDADPGTGVAIYSSLFSSHPARPWAPGAGTSLGASAWAGLVAIANQGRAINGDPTLNSPADPTQTLDALYRLPDADFHKGIFGNNGTNDPNLIDSYRYNEVVGLGTPKAALLVTDLINYGSPRTQTTLADPGNPSVFGQSVTFTATVAALGLGAGTPTGTVTFEEDGVALPGNSTRALNGGTASFTISTLSAGLHAITAVYNSNNPAFATSTSAATLHLVEQADTRTTLRDLSNPSIFGQSATFTATVAPVAPGAGTPTGTVTLLEDGIPLPGQSTVALSGSGAASFTISTLVGGSHTITAVYNGDTNFISSSSMAISHQVDPAPTRTLLSDSSNPSPFGEPVTFTATVSPRVPGSDVPTGTVTFMDGKTALPGNSTVTLDAGVGSFTIATLSAGKHSITALYNGDIDFAISGSTAVSHKVTRATTRTGLPDSSSPSVFGQPVTFTATVSPSAPDAEEATGTVTFKDGRKTLPGGKAVTLNDGTATFTVSTLSPGNHSITATYNGSKNFVASTSAAVSHLVRANTQTTLSHRINPSVFGQSVTFTVTVRSTAPGGAKLTGTVVFEDDGAPLPGIGTAALKNGKATAKISTLAVGSHTITAVYNGDTTFITSTSAADPHTVNRGPTTTTLTSSAGSPVFGQTVTFTARVRASAPGSGTPTGTVIFTEGDNLLGTGDLVAGTAVFSTSQLGAGSHRITASYQGDPNFDVSSGSRTQKVNPAPTTSATTLTIIVQAPVPSRARRINDLALLALVSGLPRNPAGCLQESDSLAGSDPGAV